MVAGLNGLFGFRQRPPPSRKLAGADACGAGTGSLATHRWREQDSNPRSLARGTTLFKIAPFDHSGNSVPATEMISARPEVGPIWGAGVAANKIARDV
jgi:hypothetical protein